MGGLWWKWQPPRLPARHRFRYLHCGGLPRLRDHGVVPASAESSACRSRSRNVMGAGVGDDFLAPFSPNSTRVSRPGPPPGADGFAPRLGLLGRRRTGGFRTAVHSACRLLAIGWQMHTRADNGLGPADQDAFRRPPDSEYRARGGTCRSASTRSATCKGSRRAIRLPGLKKFSTASPGSVQDRPPSCSRWRDRPG